MTLLEVMKSDYPLQTFALAKRRTYMKNIFSSCITINEHDYIFLLKLRSSDLVKELFR